MISDQQIPLTRIRGVGPRAAVRMTQCGILSVQQLASMSIAEFKLACPSLEKRGEAFVKGARRLLRQVHLATGLDEVDASVPPMDDAREAIERTSKK